MASAALPIAASTLIPIITGIYGSKEQAAAADQAAALEALGIQLSTDAQRQMFEESLKIAAPYREAGVSMLPEYEKAAFGTDLSPSFNLAAKYGQRAIDRAAAAAGKTGSTQVGEQIADLYQNLAADEYAKRYGYLTDLTNIGAGHAASSMNSALGTGSDIGSIYTNMYGALGQNALNAGTQRASNIATAGQALNSGLNAYNLYNWTR